MRFVDRGPLGDDIDRFVDSVCDELANLSGRSVDSYRADAVLEAASLVGAALDADGRLSDDEAWAYVNGIGLICEPAMIASPADLRASGTLSGKAGWARTSGGAYGQSGRATCTRYPCSSSCPEP